jgi:hypothetical protein
VIDLLLELSDHNTVAKQFGGSFVSHRRLSPRTPKAGPDNRLNESGYRRVAWKGASHASVVQGVRHSGEPFVFLRKTGDCRDPGSFPLRYRQNWSPASVSRTGRAEQSQPNEGLIDRLGDFVEIRLCGDIRLPPPPRNRGNRSPASFGAVI